MPRTPAVIFTALSLAVLAPSAAFALSAGFADTSADAQCKPVVTTKCGCGSVLNVKTGWCEKGDNKYQCICSQTDANVVTTGICQADGVCHAISTGGKTPQKPNVPVQQNMGAAQQQNGAPNVTPATDLRPDQSILANPGAEPVGMPTPGQSLFQDALQQLQQMSGGSGAQKADLGGGDAPGMQTAVPSWLLSGEQYQLQPSVSGASAPAGGVAGEYPIQSDGSFGNIAQQGLGIYGPSGAEVLAANQQVTQTPFERTMQDAQGVVQNSLDTAGQVGNWISGKTGTWIDGAASYLGQLPPSSQQDFLTTYGVCYTSGGCDAVEGPPTTYTAHPDENGRMTNDIFTLDGYARGDYPYVTVAGPRDQQGNTGVIPQITYKDPWSDQVQTLTNVPYMVADTGSSKYFPSANSDVSETGGNHFDVPIAIPPDTYPSATGSSHAMNALLDTQPFDGSVASVVPTDTLLQSYALANPWNSPASGGLPAYAMQGSVAFPQSDFAWTQSVPQLTDIASLQSNSQITGDSFSPDTLALGAASYNPAVAGAIQPFSPSGGNIPENPVLSGPLPAQAGSASIDVAGCGGVCEYNNSGAGVKAIQQFLNTQGYSLAADGVYGSQTENAVASFQKTYNIAQDGIVGPETAARMNQIAQENPSTQQASINGGGSLQEQSAYTPLPQPRPSAADQTAQAQPQAPEPAPQESPPPTPMQQEAQRVQNAFNASYGAYKAFLSNPTDQSLARLVSSVQRTQAIGSQFSDATIQNVASQLGGMQKTQNIPFIGPEGIASLLRGYNAQIVGGFNVVRQTLYRYLR